MHLKGVWRSVRTILGAQYVMMAGPIVMLELFAENLGCLHMVWLSHSCCLNLIRCPKPGAIALPLAAFGQGSGPILLNYVQCVGTEERLINCSSRPVSRCSHYEDAGVRCSIQTGTKIQPEKSFNLNYCIHT